MTQMVRFGMNVFEKPSGFVFGKPHDLVEWREQARARRERSAVAERLKVDGQQLTPQHQKQQLISRVVSSKRPMLVQILNEIFPERPARLEDVFEPAKRHGLTGQAPRVTEQEVRERVKFAILQADATQLKVYSRIIDSLLREMPPGQRVLRSEPVEQSVEQDYERDPRR